MCIKSFPLTEPPDLVERPDDESDLPADVIHWHGAKEAGIPGHKPVVTQDKNMSRWYKHRGMVYPALAGGPRFLERLAVDKDVPILYCYRLPR